jgi:CheY-like chemotaxis protein
MDKKRVLVVDDNIDAAETLSLLLLHSGYETATVYAGVDVLAVALRFMPNVILLDMEMPEMDGCEVALLLRQVRSVDETLLVALTGWDDDAHRQAAKDAGFDVYLVKPVAPDVLLALLAHAAERTSE